MDEVWMVSLFLTFVAFVVALLSLRKSDDTSASSAKGSEQKSPEPIPSSSQPAARYMELTLEDIEKSLERLGAVLGIESLGDKEPASDSDTQPSLTDPKEQPYRRGGRIFREWAEHDSAEAWSRPERQDRVAVKSLPLSKPELANQLFATEDWEFEDEEEICTLQCEGAGKQYYQLYWDEESLPDRSSQSYVERTDLSRKKLNHDRQTYSMDTRMGDGMCSALLQSDSNSLYLENSDKLSTSDQLGTNLVRFQISESMDNDSLEACIVEEVDSPTPQMLNELTLSLQTANGDKCSETDTELNLNLCTEKSHIGENQIRSWANPETDGDGRLGFEEFSLLHFKFQTQYKLSDPENSSMDSCKPPSPRLDKQSVPLSLSHYMERDDVSSTDDVSSSPTNSRESRFTSYDESSSSDGSLFSFLNDSNLSEANSKNADSRDSRNLMHIAKMRTDLMNKLTETDKALCLLPASEPLVANIDTSREVVVKDVFPNSFPEAFKSNHTPSCRKSEISSCTHNSERQLPVGLCTLQSAAFYSKEPKTTHKVLNVENAGYQMNTDNSGEPVKWRLEKQCEWKQMKSDVNCIHNMSHFDSPHKWQDDLWDTRSLQPEFEQDKIKPSEQVDPRRHGAGEGKEILEHPPAATATQNIMEQIEQAVQETLDHNRERSEFVRVRRAPPAPRFETLPRDDMLQNKTLDYSE